MAAYICMIELLPHCCRVESTTLTTFNLATTSATRPVLAIEQRQPLCNYCFFGTGEASNCLSVCLCVLEPRGIKTKCYSIRRQPT